GGPNDIMVPAAGLVVGDNDGWWWLGPYNLNCTTFGHQPRRTPCVSPTMLTTQLISSLSFLTILWTTCLAAGDNFLVAPGGARSSSSTGDNAQRVLEHHPVQNTDCPIETTLCNYETVESVNDDLFDVLHQLVQTPFFRYYKVDLYKDCPFWDDVDKCASRDCVIQAVDEVKRVYVDQSEESTDPST
ncbi:14793_t:CDS:2, partial [Acaulospora colombiana]